MPDTGLIVRLDARLQAIADFVRPDKIVADIGTDHALVPCYLKQQGQKLVIASDIGENPLKSAAKTMEYYGVTDIELILSDGLKGIKYADDIIIAGMGGETIVEILKGCHFANADTRLVLQPMTRHSELRRGLYQNGFEILEEKSASCDKKIYTIIYAYYTGVKQDVDDNFAYIGMQRDKEYIAEQLIKIRKKAKAIPDLERVAKEIEGLLL